MTRVCIDLFAGLGGFSAAFEDADEWEVVTVEIREDLEPDLCADVMDLRPDNLLDPTGYGRRDIDDLVVLASPPCTYFSPAGNHDSWDFDTHTPISEGARDSVALVYHALGLIHALNPDYWFVENPRGRLRWFLGVPTGTVTYCQYGRDYQKATHLWGEHPDMMYRSCSRGDSCHTRNVDHDGTSATASMSDSVEERSLVPYELSEAIRDACNRGFAGTGTRQMSVADY